MSNRKIDRVSRRKGRISWLLASAVALPVVVLVMGLSAATAHALLEEGPSAGTGLADTSVAPPADAPAVVAPGGVSPTATIMPPVPTDTPGPVLPTDTPMPAPTDVPGVLVFTGDFEAIYDFDDPSGAEPDCGGGKITLIGDPDPADPLKVSGITSIVQDGLTVAGVNVNDLTGSPIMVDFPTPIAVAGDGSFSGTSEADVEPAPGVFVTVQTVYTGTFDYSVAPATVSGTLTFNLVASGGVTLPAPAELCVASFTATFQEGPPPTAVPASAPMATTAPGLPDTGSSGGSSSDGALWAIVAGIVGLFALGTAGVASLRRRRA